MEACQGECIECIGRFVAKYGVKCKIEIEEIGEISVKIWFLGVVVAIQWSNWGESESANRLDEN